MRFYVYKEKWYNLHHINRQYRGKVKNLSTLEARVLGQLDLDPAQPLQKAARSLRMHVASVHRVEQRLRERYGMRVRPFINMLRLGYHDVVVYANIAPTSPTRQRQIIRKITDHESVSWISYLIGDYQLAFAFFCQHLNELSEFMEALSPGEEDVFSSWIVSPRVRYTQFNRKYLVDRGQRVRAYDFAFSREVPKIDDLDRGILWTLANTEHESNRAVARYLGAPAATIDRRVARLKEDQILLGSMALVPVASLGMTVYRILLTCSFLNQDLRRRLQQFCAQHPHVVFLIESLGPYNFEIGVEVSSPREIPVLSQELQAVCGKALYTVQTYMEVEDLKWSFYPMRPPSLRN